jgi:hypothetical protein
MLLMRCPIGPVLFVDGVEVVGWGRQKSAAKEER